jgi:hypothetical protein
MLKIEAKGIDIGGDTWVTIGCYRETDRLGRVLETYQKALTLAHSIGKSHEFRSSLVKMHDHKGWLSVAWANRETGMALHHLVDRAWNDANEPMITHFTIDGRRIAGEDGIELPDAKRP